MPKNKLIFGTKRFWVDTQLDYLILIVLPIPWGDNIYQGLATGFYESEFLSGPIAFYLFMKSKKSFHLKIHHVFYTYYVLVVSKGRKIVQEIKQFLEIFHHKLYNAVGNC